MYEGHNSVDDIGVLLQLLDAHGVFVPGFGDEGLLEMGIVMGDVFGLPEVREIDKSLNAKIVCLQELFD